MKPDFPVDPKICCMRCLKMHKSLTVSQLKAEERRRQRRQIKRYDWMAEWDEPEYSINDSYIYIYGQWADWTEYL